MFGPRKETEDGFESQMATNYLGHFLLTRLVQAGPTILTIMTLSIIIGSLTIMAVSEMIFNSKTTNVNLICAS
jgi:hypothetical protein